MTSLLLTTPSNFISSTGCSLNSTFLSDFFSSTSSLGTLFFEPLLFSSSKSVSKTLKEENSVIYPDNAFSSLRDVYDMNNELYIFNNIRATYEV